MNDHEIDSESVASTYPPRVSLPLEAPPWRMQKVPSRTSGCSAHKPDVFTETDFEERRHLLATEREEPWRRAGSR